MNHMLYNLKQKSNLLKGNVMSQNSCAEEMLMTAARISGVDNIQFGGQAKNDHQVQLPLFLPEVS